MSLPTKARGIGGIAKTAPSLSRHRRGSRLTTRAAPTEPAEQEEEKKRIRLPKLKAGEGLNQWSSQLTQPLQNGAAQAMLYATGLEPEDMGKPQIGVSSVWYEGNPCNMHLLVSGLFVVVVHVAAATRESGRLLTILSISLVRRPRTSGAT